MEESEMNIKGIKVPILKNKIDLPPHSKLEVFVKKVTEKRAIYDDDSDNDDGKSGAAVAKKGVQPKKPKN
jgi:hypothetical protein